MNATTMSDYSLVLDELGSMEYTARLHGEPIGTVTLTADPGWAEDSESYRYSIESDESANETDDIEEARSMVAEMLRTIRNGTIDERADADADLARDFVEGLIERGKAGAVLAALRAAKLT